LELWVSLREGKVLPLPAVWQRKFPSSDAFPAGLCHSNKKVNTSKIFEAATLKFETFSPEE